MTEPTNNPDWRDGLKREIAARVAAGQPFDDILAMLSAPAPTSKPLASRKTKAERSRSTGQVIERGENKFLIRIYTGRDTTGKRHYINETFHGKKTAAKGRLRELLAKVKSGEPIKLGNDTLDTFLDAWLQAHPDLKASTLRTYKRTLNYYVRPDLGGLMMSNIVAEDIQAQYVRLAEKGLAAGTIKLVHVLLNSAFTLAIKRRKLSFNPMVGVNSPDGKRLAQESLAKREAKTMATSLIPAFLKAAAETRFGVIFNLAFHTGCRPGELLAIKWKELDVEGQRLHIRQNITFTEGGKWYLDEPKTAGGRRTLKLDGEMVEMLSAHRKAQLEERLKAGKMWSDHGFIFCDEFGNPYSQARINYFFKRVAKAAGLPTNFSPYSARHSVATMMAEQGVHPKAAAARLGHADAKITLDIYTRATEGMDNEASALLSKALRGQK